MNLRSICFLICLVLTLTSTANLIASNGSDEPSFDNIENGIVAPSETTGAWDAPDWYKGSHTQAKVYGTHLKPSAKISYTKDFHYSILLSLKAEEHFFEQVKSVTYLIGSNSQTPDFPETITPPYFSNLPADKIYSGYYCSRAEVKEFNKDTGKAFEQSLQSTETADQRIYIEVLFNDGTASLVKPDTGQFWVLDFQTLMKKPPHVDFEFIPDYEDFAKEAPEKTWKQKLTGEEAKEELSYLKNIRCKISPEEGTSLDSLLEKIDTVQVVMRHQWHDHILKKNGIEEDSIATQSVELDKDGSFTQNVPFTKEEEEKAIKAGGGLLYQLTVLVVFKDGSITTARKISHSALSAEAMRKGFGDGPVTVTGTGNNEYQNRPPSFRDVYFPR